MGLSRIQSQGGLSKYNYPGAGNPCLLEKQFSNVHSKYGGVAGINLQGQQAREKEIRNQASKIISQRIEDDLETLLEKIMRDREVVMANGLYKKEVLDLKSNTLKEIELEKL